ncbi:hypothetical protein ACEPAF_5575 [Sanghuangporus sanghuang]|uniref:Uncharacterized protein n=1 Tax=Sanghuangporus baumii TaxID=108892 RepID=A0A9Q5I3J2_SANBA|nr:hypothetical protein A7U60_g1727 [Sanghuangporus baumii]
MLRGEKRALPVDGPPGPGGGGSASTTVSATSNGVAAAGAGGGSNGASPHKKPAKEKMPDFDWSADNYALTWRLVDELRKLENKNVLFPDHENLAVKSGDTKEDVYRRIAKVVHPEAYAHDQQIAGSRMKNKTVAMWKEYSGYCRRLQDLCTSHQVVVPANGPDENFPQEIQYANLPTSLCLGKIVISMPVFQVLRTFMPVRPEEKPKAPTVKVQRGVSSFPQPLIEDEHAVEHLRDGVNSGSYSGPVQSPSMKRASVSRELALGTAEGQNSTANGHEHRIPSQSQVKISLTDYLELRRSYQEDVRLGIFTPSEAKMRIEVLDKQRSQAENFRLMPPPPTPTASSTGSSTTSYSQPLTPHTSTRVMAPDPLQEHTYEEKAMLLGFRKPLPPHPLSRVSFKELFKAILDHAVECELQECRLDHLRKTPQLSFIQGTNGMSVDIMFMARSGLVPLVHHPLAACVRFLSRHTIHVMDVPLVIHNGGGWETTIWDFANAVVSAALRRRLSIEEIKTVQANAHVVSTDHAFRQQFQLLNDSSTFYDVLHTGLLSPNNWVPLSGSQYEEGMEHPVPQH